MQRAPIKLARPAWAAAALLAMALAAAGGAAHAQTQEAIPTAAAGASDGGAPMAEPPGDGPMRLSDHTDRGPDVLRPAGPCGGPATKPDGTPDKSPHGEVWAGVGTHGYREGGGAVCVPLKDGYVSVAVDAGSIDGWGGRRR
jgi:hypothetical protein